MPFRQCDMLAQRLISALGQAACLEHSLDLLEHKEGRRAHTQHRRTHAQRCLACSGLCLRAGIHFILDDGDNHAPQVTSQCLRCRANRVDGSLADSLIKYKASVHAQCAAEAFSERTKQ